ncbi:hypothetical protein H6G81_17635, partial [Scytonema hofmannii FACHB-248]|nr:hypothetical protein [Scytonema hofmannii FACHB-248]
FIVRHNDSAQPIKWSYTVAQMMEKFALVLMLFCTKLQQWVEQDKCRLVALVGINGVGKTALSVKLTQLAQEGFEFVIWRSLCDAPVSFHCSEPKNCKRSPI